jgi:hypothetical protein
MFVVSSGYLYAYYCDAQDVLESPIVEVKNKYVANNEYFFDVPVTKFKLIRLKNT